MSYTTSLPQFYASLLEFLMTSKQHLAAIAKDYDLTPMQAITLVLTNKDEPKPMNAFQKLYNCDASNITGIIDGLEEKGLVSRGEKEDDRRVKIVLLTRDGASVQSQITTDLIGADDSLLANLSQDELAQFRTLITKLALTL